jgi:putative endonuclease
MPFDFVSVPLTGARSRRGLRNHLAGHAAEASVARHYEDRGIPIAVRNWRGSGGEIDLIGRDGDQVIVVEVKHSKTHDLAASHVSPARSPASSRRWRNSLAANRAGLLTDVRIDLALVDGLGRIDVIENAFA